MAQALVIGGGPAGLMAADALLSGGHRVTVADAKPSLGRKFLMAGKSGLNLTKDEEFEPFLSAYSEAATVLRPILQSFGPEAVRAWADALGAETFVGSTGRIFPKVMKASPLLRAWLARLDKMGVQIRTRWRWQGWDPDGALCFDTPDGAMALTPDVTVLALGGASWSRLGSDGAWAAPFRAQGLPVTPFAPANAGVQMAWSAHMAPHFGTPLKAITTRAGDLTSRGEVVLSRKGIEGGGVYPLSPALRQGAALTMDLLPQLSQTQIVERLSRPAGKASWSNHLRKTLRLDKARAALLNETLHPLPRDPKVLAQHIKALRLPHQGLMPMDDAISTAGGVPFSALNNDLMLTRRPGTFCAGEMLDWESPTGGYLLTACFATGLWTGQKAADYAVRVAAAR